MTTDMPGYTRGLPMNRVILTTRTNAARIQGGPGQTIHNLMKTYEQRTAKQLVMAALFSDMVADSYENLDFELSQRTDPLNQGPFSKLVHRHTPPALHAPMDFVSSTIGVMRNLRKIINSNSNSPVIFHHHEFVPAYLCWLRYRHRYPSIRTVHSKGSAIRENLETQLPVYWNTPVHRFLTHAEMTSIQEVDVIAFPSHAARVLLEQERGYKDLLRNKDVRIVYTGVDTAELDAVSVVEKVLEKWGVMARPFTLVCVAPLVKEKGHHVLIEALALLPESLRSKTSCLLVGRGHLQAEVVRLIVNRGLQNEVKLLGFLPRNELVQLLKGATAFVLSSLSNVFDYALLEAGAVGLPIITTAVGGNLEMYDRECALLVPPGEPVALSEAITSLLKDKDLRQRLAEGAYQRVRSKFTLDGVLNSYLTIYEELLSRLPAKPNLAQGLISRPNKHNLPEEEQRVR